MGKSARDRKFWIINTFLLPVALLLVKALVRSYRMDPESVASGRECTRGKRPIVVATYHGHVFPLLSFAKIAQKEGRNVCVMTSPSQDGRLMDAVVTGLGMTIVKGSSKRNAVAGSLALIEAVKRGELGLLAVDGPRGPLGVPKPGFLAIAPAADADVVCVTASASRYIMFKSWDHLFLPLPFARVRMKISEFPLLPDESREDSITRLGRQLYEDAASIDSPTVKFLDPGIAS